MTTFDAPLLDQLARCYADAVVRRLLEGQEENPGEPVLSSTSVLLEQLAPDSTPGEFVDEVHPVNRR